MLKSFKFVSRKPPTTTFDSFATGRVSLVYTAVADDLFYPVKPFPSKLRRVV